MSVALPTYNERDSIRECIEDFFETGVVDEVVVCNNNAAEGTSAEVAKTRAREVFETRQGYGWSCRSALSGLVCLAVFLVFAARLTLREPPMVAAGRLRVGLAGRRSGGDAPVSRARRARDAAARCAGPH